MKELYFVEAVNEAIDEEMARDEKVFIVGEDITVGYGGGGVFGATRGLADKYGEGRVIDAPLSESAIAGAAIGAALGGYRAIGEIMFGDFIPLISDQLVNTAAKMRWVTGGQASVPVVIRTAFGAGVAAGLHHSQSFESWFTGVPGLKVVMPSTPKDAKGLLKSSIRDDDPVLFLEQKFLYKRLKGEVPEGEYTLPIGKGEIKREGDDITIIAMGWMVHKALEAADQLAKEGISAEIVDPMTLLPLDEEIILNSVEKTGGAVIVHEAPTFGGFGGEIAALLADKGIDFLDGPVKRVGSLFTPIPASPEMEAYYLPSPEKIIAAAKEILEIKG